MSTPIKAQVLIYRPELLHSDWVDLLDDFPDRMALETYLRKEVLEGRIVGYRLVRVKCEYVGATWPGAQKEATP